LVFLISIKEVEEGRTYSNAGVEMFVTISFSFSKSLFTADMAVANKERFSSELTTGIV
jgi:hypothetical protein